MVTQIEKLYINDDLIYVMDKERVLAFNHDGKFMRIWSHRGQGPGEYSKLSDFNINNGKMLLLDEIGEKILEYSMQDEYLGVIDLRIPTRSFEKLENGYALNCGFGAADGRELEPYCYAFLSDQGKIQTYVPFNPMLTGRGYSYPRGNSEFFRHGKEILTYFPYNPVIYSVSHKEGNLTEVMKIITDNAVISPETPDSDIEKYLSKNTPANIYGFNKWENIILFSYTDIENHFIKSAIINLEEGVIFNGLLAEDSNGLPISIFSYESDVTEDTRMISVIEPSIIQSIVEFKESKGEAVSSILKGLSDKIIEDSNPVLVIYEKN